ncbi:hypothetical protein KAR91_38550 [Candidatus Pacearchaeota archaeon]|nr:hypothetical protein [Candidatus Pacearchaeota archaeon]
MKQVKIFKLFIFLLVIIAAFSVLKSLGLVRSSPVPLYCEQANYVLDISSDSLKGRADFKVRSFRGGKFRLLSSHVALTGLTINGMERPVIEKDGFYVVSMKRRKESIISIEFVKNIEKIEGKHNLRLVVPRASKNRIELRGILNRHVVLNGLSFNEFETKDMPKSVSLILPPANEININWQRSKTGAKKARIFASRYSIVKIEDNTAYYRTICDYHVRDGYISSLRLILAEDCREIEVKGRGIHFTKIEKEGGQQTVRIDLVSPLKGEYRLEISYAIGYKDRMSEIFTARPVETLNEDEYIVIGSREELQIVAVEETGMREIAPSDVPAQLIKETDVPVFKAYHHTNNKYRLNLVFIRYGQAESVSTAVDEAEYEVYFSPLGKEIVRVTLQVRNADNQFMTMKLPGGAVLCSVYSMDKPIKPLRLKDETILLRLEKSIESFSGYVTFPIDICYILDRKAQTDKQVSVTLPILGVPASYLKWRLILPQDSKIKWKQMNVSRVDQFADEKVVRILEYARAVAAENESGSISCGDQSYVMDVEAMDVVREVTKGKSQAVMPKPQVMEEKFKQIDFGKLYKKVADYSTKVAKSERSRIESKEQNMKSAKINGDIVIKQKLSAGYSREAQKAYRSGRLKKARKDISLALESNIASKGALQLGENVQRLLQRKEEVVTSSAPIGGKLSDKKLKRISEGMQKESRIRSQIETYKEKPYLFVADTRSLLLRYNLFLVPDTLSGSGGEIFKNRAESLTQTANDEYSNWQNTANFFDLNKFNSAGYNRMNLDSVQENTIIDMLNEGYDAGNFLASNTVKVNENSVLNIPFASSQGTKYIRVQQVIVDDEYIDFYVTLPRLGSDGSLIEDKTAVRIKRGQTAVLGGISGLVAGGANNTGLVLTLNSDILEKMTQKEVESVYAVNRMDIAMPLGETYKFEKLLVKADEKLTITMEVTK